MAFKMRGWNAFTRKTDPPKANMPEVKVTPEMQDDRDYNIKDFIRQNFIEFDHFAFIIMYFAILNMLFFLQY